MLNTRFLVKSVGDIIREIALEMDAKIRVAAATVVISTLSDIRVPQVTAISLALVARSLDTSNAQGVRF